MENNTYSPRVKAARSLASTLQNALDFDLWLDGHPNENNALEAFLRDLEAPAKVTENDGMDPKP